MPHQCTNCSHVFPDGSKAMLSGCPDCGGNTFQFLPKGAPQTDESTEPGEPASSDPSTESGTDPSPDRVPVESAESADPTEPAVSADPAEQPPDRPPSRGPVGRATAAVREWVRVDFPSPTPRPEEATRADPIDAEEGADTGRDGESEAEDHPADPPTDSTGNAGDDVPREKRSTPDADADDTGSADPDLGAPADADVRTDPDTPTTADDIGAGTEDRAQANARRDVVADDELPSAAADPRTDRASSESADSASANPDPRSPPSGAEGGRIAAEPSGDRPDLDELRRELNDQFESIKIVAPGQYELNLMELYNREEYIIALREDGRYAIEAPETWLGRRTDRD